MKLYDFRHAPSPRRVRIFLAEKGVTVPMETVDLVKKNQFLPDYRALNPACTVPALVLDDGTVIGESAAICRYFEVLHPEPNLLGRDAQECALIEMWNRWIELNGYLRAADVLRSLRGSIDNIDAALVHMLAERFKCTQAVGELKAAHDLPPADPAREEKQITRLRQLAADADLDPAFAEKFLNFLIEEVIRNHKAIRG